MTPSDSSTKRINRRKRTADAVKEDTLELQVMPCATQMKRRRLNASKYHRLDVKEGNLVDCEISGQRSLLLLDSGTCCTCVFYSEAERLGLVIGTEEKMTRLVILWDTYQEMQIIDLEEVVISLEGGVQISVPMTVLPKELEGSYSNPEAITLGLSVLHRGRMFQTFSACGSSSLYIRKPELLLRAYTNHRHKQFQFYVQEEGSKNALPVLLDTGADDFYTTENLTCHTYSSVVPRRASLHLGDHTFLHTKLALRRTSDLEFTLGCKLFYKYDAVVDYGRALVTFKVDGKYLRVFLHQSSTQLPPLCQEFQDKFDVD